MDTYKQIARHVFAEPFLPFRLVLSDGRILPVRDSDMSRVGHLALFLETFWADDADGYTGRELRVPYQDVMTVELLDPAALARPQDTA